MLCHSHHHGRRCVSLSPSSSHLADRAPAEARPDAEIEHLRDMLDGEAVGRVEATERRHEHVRDRRPA